MTMRRGSCLSLIAAGALLTAASCGGSNGNTPISGSAGANGTAGTSGQGSAGSGTAGSASTGSAGDVGGTAGDTGSGTAGSTSGAAGAVETGAAGATQTGSAGASGTAGADGGTTTTGTAGGGAPTGLASGMSAGCGQAPPTGDKGGSWIKHNITVTGIASTVKPATGGGSWTSRVYYLDLPSGYDASKPLPVIFGGGGCGGAIVSNGNNGGFAVLATNNTEAIQIGLSYVWPQGGGACFDDDGADTPDLPYFDAIMKEIEANYCIDKSKVFVGGYSSGGWESYMLGLARGGSVVRGISPAAGGLRMDRPTPSGLPITALLLTGATDTTNPATGPTGSDLALALILQTNKCQGTATVPWETSCPSCGCNRYTGCPDDAQVVRCRSSLTGHTDGGGDFKTAIWKTWMSLPSR
jgi:poly(3-hydroxybutyrate) depolymerase